MKISNQDILNIRLQNQELTSHKFKTPTDLVRWLGAVQSQDFSGAKWGLSNRLDGFSDKDIQKEFDEGKFIRTHVMRPTWHFVSPEDLLWMEKLTGERVKRIMRSYDRQFGLDEDKYSKARKIVERSLGNKNYLTRNEIAEIFNEEGITWQMNGLAHLVSMLELDGVICNGPMKGKNHTYALVRDIIKKSISFNREESVIELTMRYFQSHGPAQIKDFVWWSGLPTADAKQGIEANKLKSLEVDGKEYYWFETSVLNPIPKVYLLPNYDEYGIAYTERSAFFDEKFKSFLDERGQIVFQHLVIYNGRLIGTWKRTVKTKTVEIKFLYFEKQSPKVLGLVEREVEKYGRFLNLEPKLV